MKCYQMERGSSPLQILLVLISFLLMAYTSDVIRTKSVSSRLDDIVEFAAVGSANYIINGSYTEFYEALARNSGGDFPKLKTAAEWAAASTITTIDDKNGVKAINFVTSYNLDTFFMSLVGFKNIQVSSRSTVKYSGLTKSVQIATGEDVTCVIDINKNPWCWGRNTHLNATLPVGSNLEKGPLPQKILNLNFKSIAIGGNLVCAITDAVGAASEVYCWNEGVLAPLSGPPVKISALAGATKIDMVRAQACAVLYNGELRCWNFNHALGLLGNFTTPATGSWPPVTPDISNVRDVAVNLDAVCALTNANEIYCWGNNIRGNVGIGYFDTYTGDYVATTQNLTHMGGTIVGYPFPYYTPQGPLAGILAPKELNFAGYYRSMVLADDGTTYGWGINNVNQLSLPPSFSHGTNELPRVSKPYVMFAPKAKFQIVSTVNTCIVPLADTKNVLCQGSDEYGILGGGGSGSNVLSATMIPTKSYWTGDIVKVATPSFMHVCIIDSLLVPWCWGRNDAGDLGYGQTIWDPDPYDGFHCSSGPGCPLNFGMPRPIIRSRVVYGM